jgi:hypothetical protein
LRTQPCTCVGSLDWLPLPLSEANRSTCVRCGSVRTRASNGARTAIRRSAHTQSRACVKLGPRFKERKWRACVSTMPRSRTCSWPCEGPGTNYQTKTQGQACRLQSTAVRSPHCVRSSWQQQSLRALHGIDTRQTAAHGPMGLMGRIYGPIISHNAIMDIAHQSTAGRQLGH